MTQKRKEKKRDMSELVLSPRTPENVERIPKDDLFKTCEASLPSPRRKRNLRMTPVRTSILGGSKPFREANNSGKKFNSRTKRTPRKNQTKHDDSADSNETFIRFERDSLEENTRMSTPKTITPKNINLSPPKQLKTADPSPKKKLEPKVPNSSPKKKLERKTPNSAPQDKDFVKPKINNSRPQRQLIPRSTNPRPQRQLIPRATNPRPQRQLIPRGTNPRPQRQLANCNYSLLTRTQSFKSTAELERDYFSSLRSF